MSLEQQLREVRAERDRLQDRVAVLEESVGGGLRSPRSLALTKMQERIFCCLYRRGFADRDAIMAAMYGVNAYDRDPKSLDVYICSLRKKCGPHDIKINVLYGRGYEMTEDSRRIVNALFNIEH